MNRKDFFKLLPIGLVAAFVAPEKLLEAQQKETIIDGPVTIKGELKIVNSDGHVALHVMPENVKPLPKPVTKDNITYGYLINQASWGDKVLIINAYK